MREPADLPWGPPWMRGRQQWAHGEAPAVPRYLLALVVGVIQLGGSVGASHAQPTRRPLDALAFALLLVAPLAITVQRRFPVQAMAAIAAAASAYLLRGYAYGPVFLGLAIGLVAAVVRGHRVVAWLGAAAVLAGDALGRLAFHTAPWSWPAAGGLLAWVLVLLAFAEVVRGWRERAATYRQAMRETRLRQAGEERLRIAQELHDVVAHHMSLINVQAGVALHLADRRPEQVEPALVAIRDASKEALTELRSLIDVLRLDGVPAPRSPVATLAGIDDIVERSGHAGLRVTKTVTGQPRPLSAAVELAAYRIVQEAITNIVRHAHAQRAMVMLDYGADRLAVTIEDDGDRGSKVSNLVQGNGISGMQERARALGGELRVGPGAGGGLRVEADLPTGGQR
ncbi:signal transduction histidine kinase [Phycicoccus badiiscoriae]|uniref:histidine kinase n=1 Tax=Pedococcus badiiscoriae TaxID=642776 RepID=A0A852WJ72_9MICO|nr:sensor histidine kinase [Pedococcus badiiscoriae]NYG06694.1 signal transduction histidine kinase [Pedococcus badiiscoriae]